MNEFENENLKKIGRLIEVGVHVEDPSASDLVAFASLYCGSDDRVDNYIGVVARYRMPRMQIVFSTVTLDSPVGKRQFYTDLSQFTSCPTCVKEFNKYLDSNQSKDTSVIPHPSHFVKLDLATFAAMLNKPKMAIWLMEIAVQNGLVDQIDPNLAPAYAKWYGDAKSAEKYRELLNYKSRGGYSSGGR